MNKNPIRNVLLIILLLMAGGCEQNFDPFQIQDQFHFSIYGVLDASADTNWVRVMPIRETLYLPDDEPIDAVVTLENLETGHVITMKDSLFEYGNGAFAWNFWTAEEILPGTRYRFSAKRSDGEISSSVVSLPADFPPPEVIQRSIHSPIEARIAGVEVLIDLQLIYNFKHKLKGDRITFKNSQLHSVYRLEGEYRTEINYTTGIPSFIIFPHPDHERIPKYDTIVAISAGTWPEELFSFPERDWERFGQQFGPLTPDQELLDTLNEISNVENGLGYLGGIVIRSSSMKVCRDKDGFQIKCE